MADGAIVFNTRLDNSDLEKALQSTMRKIDSLRMKTSQLQAERLPLVDQAQQLGVELDLAKGKLYEMQNAAAGTYSTQAIADQEARVNGLQAEWNRVENTLDGYDASIQKANIDLSLQEENAGAVSQQIETVGPASQDAGDGISAMGVAIEKASSGMDRFLTRIKNLASRVLFFSLITMALRGLRTYMSNALKTNAEFTAQLSQLKGALLTAFQPIWEAIVPALITLMHILTVVVQFIARLFSFFSGKSVQQNAKNAKAMYAEANAISAAGGAAAKAEKQLASFDEINKLSDNSAGGGGGGGSGTTMPNFSGIDTSDLEKHLKDILALVLAIGAGLLTWAIARSLGASLRTAFGLALAVAGAVALVVNWLDAWNNGIDWHNLLGMLAGAAALAGGLAIAFGPLAAGIGLIVAGLALLVVGIKDVITNGLNMQNTLTIIAGAAALAGGLALALGGVAAGISLVVTGLIMLVIGIKDMVENGKTMQNTLLIVSGILAAGIGIGLLIGSWIPAAIAAVVALVAFIVLQWDAVKKFFTDLWDGIKSIFSGAWDFIKNLCAPAANWFNTAVIQPTERFFSPIADFIKKIFQGSWLIVQAVWKVASGWFNSVVIQPTEKFFAPFVSVVSKIFSSLWAGVKAIWQPVANWFNTSVVQSMCGAWKNGFTGVKTFTQNVFNSIASFFANIVNGLIDGMNKFISGFNSAASWAGKIVGQNWSGIGKISHISAPHLAQGAVIPPNRAFAAVLGDQSTGNNLEAPEALIRKIVREESGGGNTELLQQILQAIKDGKVLVCDKYTLGRVVQSAVANRARQAGTAAIAL
jgi:hypothetical protein